VATPSTSGGDRAAGLLRCGDCGSRLACDQRYCVECGTRRGPLSPALAQLIGVTPDDEVGRAAQIADELADEEASPRVEIGMPSPLVAGLAVMALLAMGVLLGSAVSPVQESGADTPVLVAVTHSPAPAAPAPSAQTPPAAPAEATPEATPTTAEAAPESTTPASTTPASTPPTSTKKNPQPEGGSSTPAGPPIKHVFLIVLSDQGFNAAFGPASQATYLAKTLTGQGELLDNYYAVTGGELANEIALVSGQGPTPQTAANCPLYTDLTPGTAGSEGQVLGSGCVYPSQTLTVGDQLAASGKTWKAYDEDIASGGPGQPVTCRHPTLESADGDQMPTAEDPYVSWRDPFSYFHSVIDSTSCASSVVGLTQLTPDLATAASTPSLSYIIPDRCHDGSEEPCAPGQPAGLVAADGFLAKVVPQIESSPAYKAGGLIAITFDQAPQSGPTADTSGCCNTPAYPNMPAGATGATGSTAATGPAGATSTTGATGATAPSGETGASTATPIGGGRVGLLLISQYVKPASVNVTGEYDHFSLLASIENLFGVTHLGYAGAVGLLTFDQSVYNAKK